MAAVPTTKPKISDVYNAFSNPGGGISPGLLALMGGGSTPFNAPLSVPTYANSTPATISKGSPLAGVPFTTAPLKLAPGPASSGQMSPAPVQNRTLSQVAAGTPAPKPVISPAPVVTPPPINAPGASVPGATGPASVTAPRQWMKPDGTFKTPEEVAAEIGTTLKSAAGTGDIGKISLGQFGGQDKSVTDLRTDARRIGNTRNDIATGQADPYKVASESGIAYTPAELKAIESAYAGVYDPALDSALSKVEAKQQSDATAAASKAAEDKIRLQGEIDAKAPFTLSKDQVRYGSDDQPLAVGLPGDSGISGGGNYSAGANATVDAYVKGFNSGLYKASDIPDEYKSVVAQGVAQTKPAISKASNQAISNIDQLLNSDILDKITGLSIQHPSSFFSGTAVQPVMNIAKQLKGILSLENRTSLKGQGAISDFEFRVLGDAASSLGIDENGRTNLNTEDFKHELQKLQLKLQVGETSLTDDELVHLKDKGYTPEQIREFSQQQSFGNVGNTTASTGTGNRPQRNNNPGNVKGGGLADSLAVGKDDQGHLVFNSPEDGFKALGLDLTAKINGKSKYLPANPTIAQLGKVYAEDPNWPKKVAMMLGVGVNTPTTAVPFDKLIKAVATQEGFYA